MTTLVEKYKRLVSTMRVVGDGDVIGGEVSRDTFSMVMNGKPCTARIYRFPALRAVCEFAAAKRLSMMCTEEVVAYERAMLVDFDTPYPNVKCPSLMGVTFRRSATDLYVVMDCVFESTLLTTTSTQYVLIMHQVFAALRFLHFHETWHGDVIPENVYVWKDGTAKLSRFGTKKGTLQGDVRDAGIILSRLGLSALARHPHMTAADMYDALTIELTSPLPPA